ncbi:hypothetical protein HanIR_Chr12g0564491 [Helianthus annuus]|nr:hypothetical protein HanIR_Chr12g0564491 [Helianthus annuus]
MERIWRNGNLDKIKYLQHFLQKCPRAGLIALENWIFPCRSLTFQLLTYWHRSLSHGRTWNGFVRKMG